MAHVRDLARWFDPDRPAVIAHRGASHAARENTLEAFEKALALRADAVELDVRRTADGDLVVHHDPAVDGAGDIVALELSELRVLAPHVPTLDEAIEACAGMWINVEIKNLPIDPDWDPGEQVAAAVATLVGDAGLHDRVMVSSFNPNALVRVQEVDARIGTALLAVRGVEPASGIATASEGGHVAYHPAFEALVGTALAEAVAAATDAALAIVPWTVDDPSEIERLAEAGVAGIITNVPDVARRVLG